MANVGKSCRDERGTSREERRKKSLEIKEHSTRNLLLLVNSL